MICGLSYWVVWLEDGRVRVLEYARSSFVDRYAVEHVLAECAQADFEYKNCLWPLLFCSFKLQLSNSFLQNRRGRTSWCLPPFPNSKACCIMCESPKNLFPLLHVPSFACRYQKQSPEVFMSSSPLSFSQKHKARYDMASQLSRHVNLRRAPDI